MQCAPTPRLEDVLPDFAQYYWEWFSIPPYFFSLQGPEHVNAKSKTTMKHSTARHYVKHDDYDTLVDPNGKPPGKPLSLAQNKLCQAMRKLRTRPLLYPEWYKNANKCTSLCSVCKVRGHKKHNRKCPSNLRTKLNLAARDADFDMLVSFQDNSDSENEMQID